MLTTKARTMPKYASCLTLCLALLFAPEANAAGFSECLAGLRSTALASGVDAATFDSVTRGLEPNPDVLAMAQVQPEFKTPIWDYLAGLVDDERVSDGRAMMSRYGQALALARKPLRRRPGNDHGRLGRRIRFWPQLWHASGRAIARHPLLRRQPAELFPDRTHRRPENHPAWRHRSRPIQRLLGRGLRPYPIHALDLSANAQSISTATAARISSIPFPTRSARPPPICARAAGSPASNGDLRSACRSIMRVLPGVPTRKRWPPGPRAA